jgi:hypothetical protein
MSDFTAADLPAFQRWSGQFTPPMDTHDYIVHNIDVTTAAILSDLFFPRLILVRDCILLADKYEESNFEEWWTSLEGRTENIERVINHVHLWDLFEPDGPAEEQALDMLAQRMASIWKFEADQQFPDRRIVVTVADDYGPTLILYSQSQPLMSDENG